MYLPYLELETAERTTQLLDGDRNRHGGSDDFEPLVQCIHLLCSVATSTPYS